MPPLFADDYYDHEFPSQKEDAQEERPAYESPAKSVYGAQMDTSKFMTSKEWHVINPNGSAIRQAMEETVLTAQMMALAAKKEREAREAREMKKALEKQQRRRSQLNISVTQPKPS